MEPEPTMQQSNVEKIVSEQLDEPCDMDTEDAPGLSNEITDLTLDISSLRTEPLKISGFDSMKDDSGLNLLSEDTPLTPNDTFFDPFASGPDSLLLAPFSRKCRARTHILSSSLQCKDAEQSESDPERILENGMVEAVYEELLGAIIARRAEENNSADKCMTPTSGNFLSAVSESCPDAPARTRENLQNESKVSSKKKLKFDTAGLFKKLDF